MAQTPDGTPFVSGTDFVSGYPAVSQALAEQIDALRRMQPVGMITPYAGELKSADDLAAIDGWLPCDGKAYKRADFPDLYTRMSVWQVYTGFPPDTPGGSPNTANFYVPDFRGRAPFGVASGSGFANGFDGSDHLSRAIALGTRGGDHRLLNHNHNLNGAIVQAGAGQGSIQSGTGVDGGSYSGYVAHAPHRGVDSMDPYVGVNFIVWTGTTTTGKSPISGVEVAPMTTQMMIEARLEEAGIGEDEIEMLRDQLAALKDGEK